jgi:nuclease-like protein
LKLVKPASNFALGKIQTADRKLRFWGLRGGLLVLSAAPIGLGIGLLDSGTGFGAGAILAGSGFVLIMIGLGYWLDAGNTRKGLEGEQSVASELSFLSDEYLLLNDVMLPGARGNIDHVLVGPTGVFVFETKNYSGKYVCYGDRWFLQGRRQKYDVKSVSLQAKNNADTLGGLLHTSGFTVEINPVIVFTHPAVQLWLHHPTVPVLKGGAVRNYVLDQKPGFQITSAYAEKIASKILTNDRARVPVFA